MRITSDLKRIRHTSDEKYISRCIEIARNGLGTTAPNPMVGAVVVHKNLIIGEGFTSPYGRAHAEVNAIRAVADKTLLKEATLYVTLEPCSHYGKTPPCADLIAKHKIPKVVIGLEDPNSMVAGNGIQKLKDTGCEVTVGILEKECREHHKRFLTFHEKRRPYVILKWAETLDGYIAPSKEMRSANAEPYWITSSRSRQLVHQWRSEEQAILVGTNTVLEDNPKLDVRHWFGKNPTRIILDRHLRIPIDFHVFDGSMSTIFLTEVSDASKYQEKINYELLDFQKDLAGQIMSILHMKNMTSVLVEGGAKTIQTFIDGHVWDEARVFKGASTFNEGIKAPVIHGTLALTKHMDQDMLNYYIP